MECFFADLGGCNGALIRAHLVPRQLLRREFPNGVVLDGEHWRKLERHEDRYDLPHRSVRELIEDRRSWVPCCGGPTGIGGHHGLLDAHKLAVHSLPERFVGFCNELDLGWYMARRYAYDTQFINNKGDDVCP